MIAYKGEQETFNLSSNTGTSQNEVIVAIRRHEPELSVTYLPAREVDARKIILDNSRILALTGQKLVGLDEGIYKYYHYIKNQMRERT